MSSGKQKRYGIKRGNPGAELAYPRQGEVRSSDFKPKRTNVLSTDALEKELQQQKRQKELERRRRNRRRKAKV